MQAAIIFVPLAMLNITFNVFSVWKLTVFLLLVVLMSGEFVWRALAHGSWVRVETPIDKPFALVAVMAAVGTVGSVYPVVSFFGNYEWMMGALFFGALWVFFRLSLQVLQDEGAVPAVLRSATLVALLVSLYAIMQVLGFDLIVWSETSSFDISRATSTFGNPLPLGAFLSMSIPLVIYGMIAREERTLRANSFFVLPLVQAALLFTLSKGALVAELFGLGALLALVVLAKIDIKRLFAPAGLLAVGVALFLVISSAAPPAGPSTTVEGQLLGRSASSQQSMDARVELAKNSFQMIADRPLIGSGLGTFGYVQPAYRTAEQVKVDGSLRYPISAHNEFLDLGTALGVFGLLAFIFLNVVLFNMGYRRIRSSQLQESNKIEVLVCLSSCAACLMGFMTTFSNIGVYVLFAVVASIAMVASGLSRVQAIPMGEQAVDRSQRASILSRAFVVFVTGALCLSILRIPISDAYYRQGYLAQRTDAAKGSELIGMAEFINPFQPKYAIESAFSFIKIAFDPEAPDLEKDPVSYGLQALADLSAAYPYERDTHIKLANVYVDASAIGKAEEEISALDALDPNGFEGYYLRGKIAELEQDDAKAKGFYVKAYFLFPQNVPMLRRLAILTIKAGENDAAIKYLESIILLEPSDAEARRLLADLKSPADRKDKTAK